MDIQLFIPCYIDQLYPTTAFNTVKILEKAGCKVHYNSQQTCCGQPAFNSGYWDEASSLAEKFLSDFDSSSPIVTPSGSCSGFVINHYQKILAKNPLLISKHEAIKNNFFELTDFLVNVLKLENLGASFEHKVTFHDSCSALREYGIKDEPRILLNNVKGLELIEMEECDTCCGFGGTFSVKNTAISTAMTANKVRNAMEAGVEYIISTEASCLMNINSYVSKNKLAIKGIHIADILANGY
jgi:L-lactate dehydrogenase complex protein LldE